MKHRGGFYSDLDPHNLEKTFDYFRDVVRPGNQTALSRGLNTEIPMPRDTILIDQINKNAIQPAIEKLKAASAILASLPQTTDAEADVKFDEIQHEALVLVDTAVKLLDGFKPGV